MGLDKLKYKKLNLRSEVILAQLIEENGQIPLEDLIIQPDGGFNHTNRRELINISKRESDYESPKFIAQVAKRALFDAIPEGLTYVKKATGTKDLTSRKNMLLSEIKRKKDKEKSGRKYFAPFDNLNEHYKLNVEIEERRMLVGFPTGAKHTFYNIMWDEGHYFLNEYQKATLFTILPLAHEISSDAYLIALAFQSILNYKVKGELLWRKQTFGGTGNQLALSNSKLGEDFILGNSVDMAMPCLRLDIGPVPKADAYEFLPKKPVLYTIQLLQDYLIPADMAVEFNYIYESKKLELNEINTGSENRLGYTINI